MALDALFGHFNDTCEGKSLLKVAYWTFRDFKIMLSFPVMFYYLSDFCL